jgi:sterol desaturase/sphingolipid hydroxylase (fatty acid hydroxylase superfamily)
METIYTLFRIFVSPISAIFISPSEKQYWFYLLANAVIATGVYWYGRKNRRVSSLIRFCLPIRILLHRSALTDYKIWIANNILVIGFLVPLAGVLSVGAYTFCTQILRYVFGPIGFHFAITPPIFLLGTICNLLALDLGLFLAHYAQHRSSFLWEFHKVHHSAEVLTPFTVFRMHPIDLALNMSVVGFLASISASAFVFFFGTNPQVSILGVNGFEFLFYITGYHLRHSHVWIMYPGWIGRHISSPALHLIHHSREPCHHNKNMAQIFTLWDRLAGTFYLPREDEHLVFGIGQPEQEQFHSLLDLYLKPFRNAIGLLRVEKPK